MSDFSIGLAGIPVAGHLNKKPCHLITLLDSGTSSKKVSGNVNQHFISLDKPDLLNGFIQVKGVFTESLLENIVENFSTILSETPKEQVVEIMIPWHRVHSIRNLFFKAK